jgi:tRNA-binding protein
LVNVDAFLALDVRVGTIVSARVLRGSRTPSFALRVEFGELGTRTTCVEIADLYEIDDLVGLQVAAIVNVPKTVVAGLESEVLVLTVDDGRGERVLLMPERPIPDGGRVR